MFITSFICRKQLLILSANQQADRTVRNSEVAVANAADTLKDAQELRRFVQEGIDAANGMLTFFISPKLLFLRFKLTVVTFCLWFVEAFTLNLSVIYAMVMTGAVRFAQEVLKDIRSSIDTANIDLLLRQAELILEEIKARDFTDGKDNADAELSEADECEFN